MAPRPMLPPDDLYARLELPFDASFEAIEIAWRALLKQHHPDVAGPTADQLAKRINVAHDWLSDPDLRARFGQESRRRAIALFDLSRVAGRTREIYRALLFPEVRKQMSEVRRRDSGTPDQTVFSSLERAQAWQPSPS